MLHLADHDPGAKIELYYRITEETAGSGRFNGSVNPQILGPPESSHQRLGRGGLDS